MGEQSIRDSNRSQIFEILHRKRTATRPELAELTGLSRTAVGTLITEFLQRSLVQVAGQEGPSVGRPAALLEFNPNAAVALGAELTQNKWQIVAINLDAQVVGGLEVTMPDYTPASAIAALKQGISALSTQLAPVRILPGIGVGVPGLVDVRTGTIRSAREYGWTDVPIRQMIEDELQLETLIANRSKVGALAELWHTKESDKDLIYVFIGAEIAAGIAHRGELYLGSGSDAGELGHMTVLPDGPLCQCGNRGCLQELVSGPAIEKLVRARLRNATTKPGEGDLDMTEPLTVEDVFRAAEGGDTLARQVVDEVASYLGIAVANLVNLFNPELIILGGPVGGSGPVLIDPLRREVHRRAMPYALGMVTIASSELGAQAGSVGAAVLVLQQASRLLFADQ